VVVVLAHIPRPGSPHPFAAAGPLIGNPVSFEERRSEKPRSREKVSIGEKLLLPHRFFLRAGKKYSPHSRPDFHTVAHRTARNWTAATAGMVIMMSDY
jgi:hypothetical protein